MGADIKALRIRIRSVDSTLHLTRAMGLVASSKIRRANEAMRCGREYAAAVNRLIASLAACPECAKSPYMRPANEDGKTRLIVIAGDRGLCGGYNANVFRLCREYPDAEIIPIGKRAHERYGNGYLSSEHFSREEGYALARSLCEAFAAGEFTRLGIVCSRYHSIMKQEAIVRWVLPLEASGEKQNVSVLFEPNAPEVLSAAVPEYVSGMLMAAIRESFACEVAARRMAMDNAGKNAQEMISSLQLRYNRARQGAITQEITEIVAGSGE